MVPPKDRFAQGGVKCSFGIQNAKFEENFLMCELKGMEAISNIFLMLEYSISLTKVGGHLQVRVEQFYVHNGIHFRIFQSVLFSGQKYKYFNL